MDGPTASSSMNSIPPMSSWRMEKNLTPNRPPMQFADFAFWQRKMMASGAWDHQLDYWRKQLADCPPPPQLPSDRRLGRYRNFEGLQIRHPIPEGLWTELRQACSREGVTRFAWIQTVFHLFIHLYTGADDFCTGTGFVNRRDPRFHKMLGMAINTLPIRARFEGIATFRDLLRRTQERLRFALDNQELPFEIVVKDLNPGREPNNNPLFNAFRCLLRQGISRSRDRDAGDLHRGHDFLRTS